MRIEDELKGRFRNDYHKALINLVYTSNAINSKFISYLKQRGLTAQQYNVLRVLQGHKSEARSIDFLRERMLDKNSDMSRIVERLYQKKLVDREENEADRRQKKIKITTSGVELLDQMLECERKADTLLSNLNTQEISEFNQLLDKIRD